MSFLGFLKQNLAGQTHIRVDAHWASQAAILQGMAQFGSPDFVLREHEIESRLPALAQTVNYDKSPAVTDERPDVPFPLADIYDETIENLVSEVYQRDFMMFGFGPWR